MSKVVVTRPVDGITLNGDLEFLLDDTGEVKVFDSPEGAKSFLIDNGIDAEELRHLLSVWQSALQEPAIWL